MFDFLYALGGSDRKGIDAAMVTPASYHRFVLQKDGLLDESSLSPNRKRIGRRTLREIIKIKTFR